MRVAFALTLWLLGAVGVAAQTASTGVLFQRHAMTDPQGIRVRTIALLTAPFEARASVKSWLSVAAAGAFSRGSVELANGRSAKIDGLVDTRLTLGTGAGPFELRASAIVPAGRGVTSIDEVSVIGMLSSDVLPFAMGQWSGGGFAADLAYRLRLSTVSLVAHAGYTALRTFTTLGVDSVGYQPGGQFRGRLLVESGLSSAGSLSVMLGFLSYSADSFNGQRLFTAGQRGEAVITAAFPTGARESVLAYAGLYVMAPGSIGGLSAGGTNTVSPFIWGATEAGARQVLLLGAEMHRGRTRYALAPRVEFRAVRSASGLGQGWIAALGSRAEYRITGERLGRRILLEPSAKVSLGRVLSNASAKSMAVGLEAGVGLRWEGTR